ncbi:MAG: hypothetical protein WD029_02600 [Microthrixaceae bacterium]
MRALVIVSGGDAENPFTTPEQACASGLAAGNTSTALRQHLLAEGHSVFTSPAKIGPGMIEFSPGFGGFAEGPDPLPAALTVNSVGDIDEAGQNLAAFWMYLQQAFGVSELDVIGHSMGGLFARAAIRILHEQPDQPAQTAQPAQLLGDQIQGEPLLKVRSLLTIGTPWQGSFAADFARGDLDLAAAQGVSSIESVLTEFAKVAAEHPNGAGIEVTRRYLSEMAGNWNDQQSGVLDSIPVTLIAGDYFRLADPQSGTTDSAATEVWPNDGLVACGSALAEGVPTAVLGKAQQHVFPDVHSIFFADKLGLRWDQALTWDPQVLETVSNALK